jgi:predicted nuclease of predicted toxin-antitoxin system
MRILLDECIPKKLKKDLASYQSSTVPEESWAGKKNGELLALAEDSGFDVFLTIDRGIAHQQNLVGRRISVVLIVSKSNRLADIQRHVPGILQILGSLQPGQYIKVGPGTNP